LQDKLNTFKIGMRHLLKPEFSILGFIALCYPIFRAMLPFRLQAVVDKTAQLWNSRNRIKR